jgi:hypothetical protein
MHKHVLEKIIGIAEGKRKYPAWRCHVCATHKKRSETRYICKFCLVTPQGGMFPEISHPQTLLDTMVRFHIIKIIRKFYMNF